ncbi:MAG: Alpha/beta hydrolase family protein [candidate division WS6 bacterium OLB21]|nr:MAG: Alpha/beta hydrolase family protein [candidate division WS6 bacterium OLB21]
MHRFDRELVDAYGLSGRRLMDPKAFVQMGMSVTTNIVEDDLKDCSVPVQFIFGSEDKITSPASAKKKMQNAKGDFKFAEIANAGHIVTLEKPMQVAEIIIEFLRNI